MTNPLPDPPTRIGRTVLGFLDAYPNATADDIALGMRLELQPVLVTIGQLLADGYIDRDGLGGYLSRGVWTPGFDGLEPVALEGVRIVARRHGWAVMEAIAPQQGGAAHAEEARRLPEGA